MRLYYGVLSVNIFILFSLSPGFCMDFSEEARRDWRKYWNLWKGNKKSKTPHPFSELNKHEDILLSILRQTDPETLDQLPFVCKRWRSLVQQDICTFNASLAAAEPFHNYFPSPCAIPHAHYILNFCDEINTLNSKIVKNFAYTVSQSPLAFSFLGKYYSQLNPVADYPITTLAAKITKNSPQLQSHLWRIIDKNRFELENFPKLVEKANNHLKIHKYLILLKILTLSGDESAKEGMELFELILFQHLKSINHRRTSFYYKYPLPIGFPFWGAYTVKRGKDSAFREQFRNLKFMLRSDCINQRDVDLINAFKEYALLTDPLIPIASQQNFEMALSRWCSVEKRLNDYMKNTGI